MSNTDIYFDWKYYINLYPELRENGINTYETAFNHWRTYGKKENRICNTLFEPDNNPDMNNILFCIIHHSNSNKDTEMLEQCIQSIRRFYTNNDILIIKTSTSIIPDSFTKYNIKVINKKDDNSFLIGAYQVLIDMPHKHYILLHDSMFLLKKLTSEILYKRFYTLWYFKGPFDFPIKIYKQYYIWSNLNSDLKAKMNDLYYNKFAIDWLGVFGGCSGGQINYLKQIMEAININDINNALFYGNTMAQTFERYIGLIAKTLDIYDTFTNSPALNGNCDDTYILLNTYTTMDDIYKKAKENNYNGYFWKIHINRVSPSDEN